MIDFWAKRPVCDWFIQVSNYKVLQACDCIVSHYRLSMFGQFTNKLVSNSGDSRPNRSEKIADIENTKFLIY